MLSPLETLALSKLITDKAEKSARSSLSPGTHDIDLTVHIHGSMAIAEDTTKAATASIPLLAALAFAIDAAGAVGPAVEKAILAGVARALREGEEGAAGLECRKGLLERIEQLKDAIASTLPRVPVKGAVRAVLAVDVVDQYAIAAK